MIKFNVKKLVFSSSATVYGGVKGIRLANSPCLSTSFLFIIYGTNTAIIQLTRCYYLPFLFIEVPQVGLTEDLPTQATNPYGWTKVMIEQILQDVHNADKGISYPE